MTEKKKRENDPNQRYTVFVQCNAYLSSECRLCEFRTIAGEATFAIITHPGEKLEVYCAICYREMYRRILLEFPHAHLVDPNTKSGSIVEAEIELPGYMVKNGEGFNLFRPTDPIDVGLIKQRVQRRRRKEEQDYAS